MQSRPEGRGRGGGGGRGASRGGRGLKDSSGRGGARGRGASRGNGRGRGRGGPAATSLGVQKGGKLRSLKNQIRGVERLLRKEGIEPRARTKQAALLEQLKAAMVQHDQSELERKYAVRYHKIRFFERVKLERQMKQVQKGIADAPEAERPQMERQLAKLRDDLQYVLNFPKGEKYVSITKEVEEPAAAAALEAERLRLRALVARQLAEVAMLTEADEGASLQAAAAATAAQSVAGHDAAASDEDDFFLPDDAPDGEEAAAGEEAPAGIWAPESSEAAAEAVPASPLLPPLKRQRGGRAVALRNAAKEASQADPGPIKQPGKAAEPRGGAAVAIERRPAAAATPSAGAEPAAQHALGASNSVKAERRTVGRSGSTPRAGAAPRSQGARPAGQQRPAAKPAWLPRGLAQQKQHLKYEKNTAEAPRARAAPAVALETPGSAAAGDEKAPLRKRAEGGRKRRK